MGGEEGMVVGGGEGEGVESIDELVVGVFFLFSFVCILSDMVGDFSPLCNPPYGCLFDFPGVLF